MDGANSELTCPCGYENFERVIVERVLGRPIVTDFVACVGCRAMYFAPLPVPAPVPLPDGHGIGTMVLPKGDTDEALKQDAAEAAKAYRKPGRSGRLGPGGRR